MSTATRLRFRTGSGFLASRLKENVINGIVLIIRKEEACQFLNG